MADARAGAFVPLVLGAAGTAGTFALWLLALQLFGVDLLTFSIFFVIPAGAAVAGMGCGWGMYRSFERRQRRPPRWADAMAIILALLMYGTAQRVSFVRSDAPTISAFLLAREESFWVGVKEPPRARHIDLSGIAEADPR